MNTKKYKFCFLAILFALNIHAQKFHQLTSKLIGNGSTLTSYQGTSVSLSNDGKIAIIGGSVNNDSEGAVWVYSFNGSNFVQLSSLVGSNSIGKASQGFSASISGDGKTIIIGGIKDNSDAGASWVYTYNGSNFVEVSKLVGTGAIGKAMQGYSSSLSNDGKVAVIGGPKDNNNLGATWVYSYNGNNFIQIKKIVVTSAIGTDIQQGRSVSVSGDGNTIIIGAIYDNRFEGAAWIYTYNGSNFVYLNKLIGSGAINGALQGQSVNLSDNGKIAIVGGRDDNTSIGAVWVYTYNGNNFVQLTKLISTNVIGLSVYQGYSVDISGDGNTIITGGFGDNFFTGASWVYTYNGSNFIESQKIIGKGPGLSISQQGVSVSLSFDGKVALIGGPQDNNYIGAAWVFSVSSAPIYEYNENELSRVC